VQEGLTPAPALVAATRGAASGEPAAARHRACGALAHFFE